MRRCIILISNANFLEKTKNTIKQIRQIGRYTDDIVILVGEDLKNLSGFDDKVIVKYFPEIDRTKEIELFKKMPISDGREVHKVFQFHKIHCFDVYFKQWDKCLYMDAGMQIFKELDKILNLECDNKVLAHSDAYPTYEWTLKVQFNSNIFPELYKELENNYNLDVDYFQSGVMLYDTKIISESIKDKLLTLANKYINSKTNEQAIMNLLFNCELKIWSPLPLKDDETYYYDYWERNNLKYYDYIMLKYPKTV